jgi:hypothetical protein
VETATTRATTETAAAITATHPSHVMERMYGSAARPASRGVDSARLGRLTG